MDDFPSGLSLFDAVFVKSAARNRRRSNSSSKERPLFQTIPARPNAKNARRKLALRSKDKNRHRQSEMARCLANSIVCLSPAIDKRQSGREFSPLEFLFDALSGGFGGQRGESEAVNFFPSKRKVGLRAFLQSQRPGSSRFRISFNRLSAMGNSQDGEFRHPPISLFAGFCAFCRFQSQLHENFSLTF